MDSQQSRIIHLIRKFIQFWALLGSFLLILIVLMTAYSAVTNLLFNAPVAGDFEIVEMGVAISVFTFLPFCQLTKANVSVDLFTMWAGPRLQNFMSMLASLTAIAFAVLLFWRMSIGMADYREYEEYTAILGIPLWVAFPPILFSLALLAVASLITTGESLGFFGQGDGETKT
ncbi:MAG: TRAP transporter small permease [SAR324 cluster bacterium]|nr:TRAP transporter small permease [SAR324 cluster bacterium]